MRGAAKNHLEGQPGTRDRGGCADTRSDATALASIVTCQSSLEVHDARLRARAGGQRPLRGRALAAVLPRCSGSGEGTAVWETLWRWLRYEAGCSLVKKLWAIRSWRRGQRHAHDTCQSRVKLTLDKGSVV